MSHQSPEKPSHTEAKPESVSIVLKKECGLTRLPNKKKIGNNTTTPYLKVTLKKNQAAALKLFICAVSDSLAISTGEVQIIAKNVNGKITSSVVVSPKNLGGNTIVISTNNTVKTNLNADLTLSVCVNNAGTDKYDLATSILNYSLDDVEIHEL